jgi:hypothetical protein
VIRSFRSRGTEDVFNGLDTKAARRVEYRICFIWTEVGPESVEIIDYH